MLTILIYAENSKWRVERVARRNRKVFLRKVIPLEKIPNVSNKNGLKFRVII
jgi:hypothetical protein